MRISRVSVGKLIDLGDQAFKKKSYKEAARYFEASTEESISFYPLFMEILSHYLALDLSPFKRKLKILNERYEDNRYLAELDCFISLKKDPIDKVLEHWVGAFEKYPSSKKIKKAINKLKSIKDPLLWKRHSHLRDFVSFPSKVYRGELKEKKSSPGNVEPRSRWLSTLQNFLKGKVKKEKRTYPFFVNILSRLFYIAVTLVILIFGIRSIQIGVTGGLEKLFQYWKGLSDSVNEKIFAIKEGLDDKEAGNATEKSLSQRELSESVKLNSKETEETKIKNDHLASLLKNPGEQEYDKTGSRIKSLTKEEFEKSLNRARTLLQKGKRNQALIIINSIFMHQINLGEKEKAGLFKSIALSFSPEKNPSPIPMNDVTSNPKKFYGCTVIWKGRLDRIIREGDGNFLEIRAVATGKSSNTIYQKIMVFFRKDIGNARIGENVIIIGEITPFPHYRKFQKKIDRDNKILLNARILNFSKNE